MGKIWDYMSVKGKYVLPMKWLMELSVVLIGAFHVCLLFFFGCFKVYPMVYLNIFSVALYIFCFLWIRRGKNLLFPFNIVYIEVIVHSAIAALLLGTESGFTMYLIALLPLGYYASYYFSVSKKQSNPMFYITISAGTFVLVRIAGNFIEPMYSYGNEKVDRFIYIINYFVAIVSIVMAYSTLMNQIKILERLRLKQNKQLEKLSKTDSLTGLANRRSIEERYAQAETLKEDYALILGDLDNFKRVNDTYGHNAGDIVLKMVADSFKHSVREEDMVCRWGGEEILVFLPKCDKADAIAIAEKIRESISRTEVMAEGERLYVTMTFGVALSKSGKDFNEIVKKADDRLYAGKRSGKNRVIGI